MTDSKEEFNVPPEDVARNLIREYLDYTRFDRTKQESLLALLKNQNPSVT